MLLKVKKKNDFKSWMTIIVVGHYIFCIYVSHVFWSKKEKKNLKQDGFLRLGLARDKAYAFRIRFIQARVQNKKCYLFFAQHKTGFKKYFVCKYICLRAVKIHIMILLLHTYICVYI